MVVAPIPKEQDTSGCVMVNNDDEQATLPAMMTCYTK